MTSVMHLIVGDFFQDSIALQTSSESFASVPFISLNSVGSLDSSDK